MNNKACRERLIRYMENNPSSFQELAKKMKIDARTIKKIFDGDDVSIKTVCIMWKYLQDNE